MGVCISKAAASGHENSILAKQEESIGLPDSDHEGEGMLQQTLEDAGSKVVVIKFIDGCATCRVMSKPFENLSKEFPDVVFLEATIDQNHSSAKELGIKFLPTFIAFKNHQEIGRHVGVKPDPLADFVRQVVRTRK